MLGLWKDKPSGPDRAPLLLVAGQGWGPGPALLRQLNNHYRLQYADRPEPAALEQQLLTLDRPCHLIGHDLGSMPALLAALNCPQQVSTLTLINPAAFGLLHHLHDWESWDTASTFASRFIALSTAGADSVATRELIQFWFGRTAWWLLRPDQKSQLLHNLPGIVDTLAAIFHSELHRQDLRALAMPVHLVCGRQAPLPTRRLAERMYPLIPVVSLSLTDRSGLVIGTGGPARMGECISDWLLRQEAVSTVAPLLAAQSAAWSDAS